MILNTFKPALSKVTAASIAALFALTSASYAEQVRIPVGQQSDAAHIEKPRTGESKTSVEQRFGTPVSRHGPVGEPPISHWEYDDFTVYFEYGHVVHAVSKHKSDQALKR